MTILHNLSPVALDFGFFKIHWYGLMYLLGFAIALGLGYYRRQRLAWEYNDLSDCLFYCALGVILGGRLGYVLFYNTSSLFINPLSIFYIWQGGMSFHGAVIGVIISFLLLARNKGLNSFDLSDFILPLISIGLGLGRLGNYINGELWGKPTNADWGVIFPASGDLLPRHPSQLYELFLEGIILFIVLWFFTLKARPRMTASGLFLLGYGIVRFSVEFVREPDRHLGYIAMDWVTMGQILSFPMIVVGIIMLYYGYKNNIIAKYGTD